jgi:hypothetical protein
LTFGIIDTCSGAALRARDLCAVATETLLGSASSGSERNSPVTMISSIESSGAAASTFANPHDAQIDNTVARDLFTRMNAPIDKRSGDDKAGG